MKILFAEDEADLQDVVKTYLEYQGHHVTAVDNGAEAVDMTKTDAYDAIVMDIMMPVMDGISAMKKIRESGNTIPAIFLTAKSQVEDRIEGLDAGADDYLTKPFSMEELNARLRALHRRMRDYKVRTLTYGNLELDTEQSELKAVNTISLALKEVKLLGYMIAHAGQDVTAGELLDEVWPGEDAGDDMVEMYISFLRGKLESVQANVTIMGDRERPFRLMETI
ncbi:MAG: response regulator transcription factor [Lachnospiraceae bacterium]|nr:response regulator transcription factor [Lachnospiraceae bacterium]